MARMWIKNPFSQLNTLDSSNIGGGGGGGGGGGPDLYIGGGSCFSCVFAINRYCKQSNIIITHYDTL